MVSDDLADACAELTELLPALTTALARDTASSEIRGPASWMTATVVNADVLGAMLTLNREVPDALAAASETLGERWHQRDLATCLRAIPRLADRLGVTGHVTAEKVLARQAFVWLRITKRALGLRKPDVSLGYRCPFAEERAEIHPGAAVLIAAGDEGFLRPGADGLHVEWVAAGQVYCPEDGCGASWAPSQWPLLGRMLVSAGAEAA